MKWYYLPFFLAWAFLGSTSAQTQIEEKDSLRFSADENRKYLVGWKLRENGDGFKDFIEASYFIPNKNGKEKKKGEWNTMALFLVSGYDLISGQKLGSPSVGSFDYAFAVGLDFDGDGKADELHFGENSSGILERMLAKNNVANKARKNGIKMMKTK